MIGKKKMDKLEIWQTGVERLWSSELWRSVSWWTNIYVQMYTNIYVQVYTDLMAEGNTIVTRAVKTSDPSGMQVTAFDWSVS